MVTFVHFFPSVDLYMIYLLAPVTLVIVTVAVLLLDELSLMVGALQRVIADNTELYLLAVFFVLSRAETLYL